jgi:RND family efflux transporter MFP subunit
MTIRLTRIVAPILVLAASVGAYAVLHATRPAPEKNEQGPRPTSVFTAPVVQTRIALTVNTQGEVRARTEIELMSQVAGRIVAVSPEFTEGGLVEPDVSLLKIEDTDYRLALSQAKARVAEAQVGLQQALADADVARRQLRNDPSASDLALKKPQVAQARATLEAARANLEQAKLNLERTDVALPFRGRVVDTQVDVGQYISPGMSIGRVFATDVVEIRLPLNDSQLASLALPIGYTAPEGEGMPVILSAKVAGQRQTWNGRLVRLDASVDPDTRLLYAIAEVIDPYGANVSDKGMPLAVGLFVDAEIEGRELADAISIPSSGLRAGDVVFLVSPDGRLQVREVDVIHADPKRVIVGSGLTPGERVVTSAIRNPIEGMALSTLTESGSG